MIRDYRPRQDLHSDSARITDVQGVIHESRNARRLPMLRFVIAFSLSLTLIACTSTPTGQAGEPNGKPAVGDGAKPHKPDANATNPPDSKAATGDAKTDATANAGAAKPATHVGTIKLEPIQTEALKFSDLCRKDDRILFVGDDVTQQQYFTRSLTSALMGYKPTWNLRFFNGGMNGATAGSANEWIDELLTMTSPTVVYINFGLNDGGNKPPDYDTISKYEKELAVLINKAQAFKGVREVVVLSAPAIQTGKGNDNNKGGYNRTLFKFALSAQTTAGLNKAKFIDLFEPMRLVYAEAAKVRADGLSLGGRLPTEEASTIIASVVLWGMGVDQKEFNRVGWAPLKAVEMGTIRGALGIQTSTPNYTQGTNSRTLYEKLREHDELFFVAWRLAGPKRIRDRGELIKRCDEVWAKLDTLSRSMYAK